MRQSARQAVLLISAAGLCVGGCAALRKPETEVAIASAVGRGALVEFRTEAGPLDEPLDLGSGALSLESAVRLGVERDPGLQAALARVRIALADSKQARLLPNPVLTVLVRFPVDGGRVEFEASLVASVVSAMLAPSRARMADERLRSASEDAVTGALDLVMEIEQVYAAAQASDEVLALLRQREALLERLIALAEDRLAVGEGIRTDVTSLRAQRVELDIEVAESRRRGREARVRLARLVGAPSDGAAWTLDAWTAPAPGGAPVDAWVAVALRSRPEIASIRHELGALGVAIDIARWEALEGLEAGVEAEDTNEDTIGPLVSVPVPIFDSGGVRRERTNAQISEAAHRLTEQRRKVVEEVRLAHDALAASLANLERVRDGLLPLQERRRVEVEAAFRAGQESVTPLLLAEDDLKRARVRLVDLEEGAATAHARLRRAAGGTAAMDEALATRAPENEGVEE